MKFLTQVISDALIEDRQESSESLNLPGPQIENYLSRFWFVFSVLGTGWSKKFHKREN